MSAKLSLIIPCYNEVATIADLLEAIRAQTHPLSGMEVIIADGMSDDGTRQAIAAYAAGHPELAIRVVDNPRRVIPAALNRAISAASGEVVIRLDAHSEPYPDYVARCLEALEATGAANVGGAWEIRPGGEGWAARAIAAAAAHPLGAGDARYRVQGEAGPVETVPFGAFRRAWLERAGPFDETLLTNEDYEYNQRIRQAGGVVWFDPAIRSIYYARPTLAALAHQYARYGFWKARMLLRHPDSLRWRQALPPLFVLAAILLLLLSPFSRLAAALLTVQLGAYAAVLLLAGGVQAARRRDPALVLGFPAAVVVMHFAWGAAFLWSALRAGVEGIFGKKRSA